MKYLACFGSIMILSRLAIVGHYCFYKHDWKLTVLGIMYSIADSLIFLVKW